MSFHFSKALAFATLAFFTFANVNAQDKLPTGEEVMAKCAKATGTAEALKGVKSIKSVATLDIPQFNISGSIEILKAAGGKGVAKIEVAGTNQKSGSDGETAWAEGPAGTTKIEGMQGALTKFQVSMFPMLDYAKFFKSVKCTKKIDFEGEECYVVECELEEGEPLVQYYSVKSGLLSGVAMTVETPMGSMEITNVFKDYKAVNGIMFSHKSVSKLPGGMEQEVNTESIELNVAVDDKEFAYPGK